MRENIRKNKGQSPIQYATIILVIVALVGSWMAYSSAGQASTKELARKKDISSLKKDISRLRNQNATLRERIKALEKGQSSLMKKIGAKRPAKLTVTSISAPSVKTGKKATVKITVTNTGEKTGSMEVAPTIEGEEIGSKTVKLKAGETRQVEFTVRKEEAGEYTIKADGRTTTLTVTGKKGPAKKLDIGLSIWGMYGSWEHCFVQAGRWYAADHNIAFSTANALMKGKKQVKDIHNFESMGMDGIMVGPVSSTAPADAIESAVKAGIPVATVNSDVKTDAISIGVYYGNKNATASLAREVVKYLKENVKPIGKVSGTVLHLQGSLEMSIGRKRSAGIYEVFEGNPTEKTNKYPHLKHIVKPTYFQKKPGMKKTFNVLQAEGGDIDAIIGNSTSCRGAVEALKKYGKEKGEVFIAAHGGTPPDIQMVKDGWFQRAYEQPTHFYLPIAMHYLKVAIENGKDALPDVGETITAEDLDISGKKHLNMHIWKHPTWAPATIENRYGHRWFKTSGRIITPKNVDDPTIWGNIFGKAAA